MSWPVTYLASWCCGQAVLTRDCDAQLHSIRKRFPLFSVPVIEGTEHSMLHPATKCGADMHLPIDSTAGEVITALLALYRRNSRSSPSPAVSREGADVKVQ